MRNKKKGFTLVELLVVIAILAILATVAIVGYTSFTKKASLSNDEAIVTQMNNILKGYEALDEKARYPHQAVQQCIENGFIYQNLKAESKDHVFLYDSKTNRFCLYNEESKQVVFSDKDSTLSTNDADFFECVDASLEKPTQLPKHSLYLYTTNKENYNAHESWNEVVELNAGIDTGAIIGVNKLKYTNNTEISQNVIIRTNSINTSIEIDAKDDTITHYGLVNDVNIIRTAYGSYHEEGIASFIQCSSGKVVVESNAKVNTIVLTDVQTAGDKVAVVQTNGGEVSNIFATTQAVAQASNAVEETEHDTLTIKTTGEDANILGETEDAALSVVAEKKTEAIENGKAKVQRTCEHKFEGDSCVICGISKKPLTQTASEDKGGFVKKGEKTYEITSLNGLALFAKYINLNQKDKVPEGSTIKLAVDIDLKDNYWEPISQYLGDYTFDGCGHTIKNMSTTTEWLNKRDVGFFSNAEGWTIKNLNFDGARVEGINHVAVIVGSGMCTNIENCTVKNATVIARVEKNGDGKDDDGDKAGAICGYLSAQSNASCVNCYVENVTVTAYRDCGGLIGYAQGSGDGLVVENNTLKNVRVINDQTQPNYNNYDYNGTYNNNFDKVAGRKDKTMSATNVVENVTIEYIK